MIAKALLDLDHLNFVHAQIDVAQKMALDEGGEDRRERWRGDDRRIAHLRSSFVIEAGGIGRLHCQRENPHILPSNDKWFGVGPHHAPDVGFERHCDDHTALSAASETNSGRSFALLIKAASVTALLREDGRMSQPVPDWRASCASRSM